MPKGVYLRTKKHREAISQGLLKIKFGESIKGNNNPAKRSEVRKKMSESSKGKPKLNRRGIRYSPSTEFKKGHKGYSLKGEKSPAWQGGISFEPYSVDWTKTLKRSIRQRDEYTCQICNKEPAIIVHHIDYDKKNCNPENLITLCHNCHPRTNHNRKRWIEYFRAKPP